MAVALADTPTKTSKAPKNIIKARIDRETGLLTYKTDHTSRFEYFLNGTAPTEYVIDDSDSAEFGDDFFLNNEEAEEAGEEELLF
jgi:penicillin-binding protein 1A